MHPRASVLTRMAFIIAFSVSCSYGDDKTSAGGAPIGEAIYSALSQHKVFRAATVDERDWVIEVEKPECARPENRMIRDPLTIGHGDVFGVLKREFVIPRDVSKIHFDGGTAWYDASIAVFHQRFTLVYSYGVRGALGRDDVASFFHLDESEYDHRFQRLLAEQLVRTGVGAEEAKRLVEAGIQRILARSPEDRNRRAIMARGSALQRESDIAAAIELALLLGAKSEILPVSDDPCDGVDVAARNEAGDQWLHVSTISTDSRTLYLIPASAAKTQTAGVRLSWALTEYAPDGDYVGSGLIAIGQTEDEFEIDPVRLILEFLGVVPVSAGPEDTSARKTHGPADDREPRP